MRILLVEDEKKVAHFVKRGLKEEGYTVDTAFDGEEGHLLATTNDYDVILLDIMLPKVDGVTLCKKLRTEKNSTPILMLTAKDSVRDKVDGLDAGANDYLPKPFAFAELLARIRVLLRDKEDQPSTRIVVGDLTLDISTHKLTRSGKEINLTMREYALIEYFMRNPGVVITRTMIFEHVWDINFDTYTNIIDVYVNHLRKKIDEGFEKKIINTVRGRGYILKE